MPDLGETLGRYTLLKRLAAGGMGEIFLAARMGPLGFAPPVALKVLRDELASDAQFIEMLVDEAKISMFLNHQNVVSVLDFGEDHGRYYIAMELVQGVTLKAIFDGLKQRNRRLDLAATVYITNELCRALKYAHTRTNHAGEPLNIVHRDVTPANVLISVQGEVKLTDFGIARAKNRVHQTQAGVLKGKFGYMAPEMLRYEAIDARADIFCAGVMLYEMVAGQHPVEGASIMEAITRLEEKDVRPPSHFNPKIPRELDDIVMKALEPKPAQRWSSAGELAAALQDLVLKDAARRVELRHGADIVTALIKEMFPAAFDPPLPREQAEQIFAMVRQRTSQEPDLFHGQLDPDRVSTGEDLVASDPLPGRDFQRDPSGISVRPAIQMADVRSKSEVATHEGFGGLDEKLETVVPTYGRAEVSAGRASEIRARPGIEAEVPDVDTDESSRNVVNEAAALVASQRASTVALGSAAAEAALGERPGFDAPRPNFNDNATMAFSAVRGEDEATGEIVIRFPDRIAEAESSRAELLAEPRRPEVKDFTLPTTAPSREAIERAHEQERTMAQPEEPRGRGLGEEPRGRGLGEEPRGRGLGEEPRGRGAQAWSEDSRGRDWPEEPRRDWAGGATDFGDRTDTGAPDAGRADDGKTVAGMDVPDWDALLPGRSGGGGVQVMEPPTALEEVVRDFAEQELPSRRLPSFEGGAPPSYDDGATAFGGPRSFNDDKTAFGMGAVSADEPSTIIPDSELVGVPRAITMEGGASQQFSDDTLLDGISKDAIAKAKAELGLPKRPLISTPQAALPRTVEDDVPDTNLRQDALIEEAMAALSPQPKKISGPLKVKAPDAPPGASANVPGSVSPSLGSPSGDPFKTRTPAPPRPAAREVPRPVVSPVIPAAQPPPVVDTAPKPLVGVGPAEIGSATGRWMRGELAANDLSWGDDAAARRAVATRNAPGTQPAAPVIQPSHDPRRTAAGVPRPGMQTQGGFMPPPNGLVPLPQQGMQPGMQGMQGPMTGMGNGAVPPAYPMPQMQVPQRRSSRGLTLGLAMATVAVALAAVATVLLRTKIAWPEVTFESTPTGATVRIDDKVMGERTPARFAVRPNVAHRVELRLEGYAPRELGPGVELSFFGSRTYQVELEKLAPKVRTSVPARVFVNDILVGTGTEVELVNLNPAVELKLRVEADGRIAWSQAFARLADIPTALDVPLVEQPPPPEPAPEPKRR